MNKKMREIKTEMDKLNEEAKSLFEVKNYEGASDIVAEIEVLEKAYQTAEKLFQEEKEKVTNGVVNKSKATDKVKSFANNIKLVMQNKMSEGINSDGGYTVPEDVLTDVEKLRESEFSLEQLVSVETVSTNKGRRTFKKRSQQTGFTKIGEGGKIGKKQTPQYSTISYEINKYGGYYPVTNELLEDSDANIYNDLITWIAGDSRATRNNLIIDAINTKPEVKLNGIDDIKKTLNVTLGQAFKATSKIVTNDDGLQYLDTLKDSDGKYLLTSSPSNPMKLVLSAGATTIPVDVIPNSEVASKPVYSVSADTTVKSEKNYYTKTGAGTTESPYVYTEVASPTGNPSTSSYYEVTGAKYPFIIGDLKEGIKLFDRKKLNIMASNVAVVGSGDDALNAFEEDLTLLRGIEREDVVVRDEEAFVNGYIENSLTASA